VPENRLFFLVFDHIQIKNVKFLKIQALFRRMYNLYFISKLPLICKKKRQISTNQYNDNKFQGVNRQGNKIS
jgi:hypothetical protein